jgi:proline iminopeptidase
MTSNFRTRRLEVPTLMMASKYGTVDPKAMEARSKLIKKGNYLYFPNGSHLAM